MNIFRNIIGPCLALPFLIGCGGGSTAPAPQTVANTPKSNPGVSSVQITGTITYDRVPHNPATNGLDYNATIKKPARGIVVELVDSHEAVLEGTISGSDGSYSFSVNPDRDVKILARAELRHENTAKWDIKVTDNTQGNALYVLSGSLASSGSQNQIRDLHAPSGWDGQTYANVRAAAPFAILDPLYDGVNMIADIDPDVDFPELELRWSPDNRAAVGNKADGNIGTSAYIRDGEGGHIYLLGDAGRDTDEYDPHVIVHEWGHYFEHRLSRTDSIGGLHGLNDRLDSRVALGEGWGNALAAMVTGDPVYRDSSGTDQKFGFSFDLEDNSHTNPGWFNEGSVGSIIYDLFDSESDGADQLSLGIGPIYQAMTSTDFKDSDLFTTLYVFAEVLRGLDVMNQSAINDLLAAQSISGIGPDGSGEHNSGAIASSLPIFQRVTVGGAAVEICSVNDAGRYNKLGNRDFIHLDIPLSGSYHLSMTKTSGDAERDPDFDLWQHQELMGKAASSIKGSESLTVNLEAGSFVIDAYDYNNINGNSAKTGDGCYDFSVN